MITNSYDDTKKMLKTLRNLNEEKIKKTKMINEQEAEAPVANGAVSFQQGKEENAFSNNNESDSDYAVINNVKVVIHSEDPEDMELTDEEKGKISQLIDDFRAEVAETAEFGDLNLYETNAKLDGKIGRFNIQFTLSTGDDTGLYVNGQMLKIDENSLLILEKLLTYRQKFSNTINELLVKRRAT